jgi:hypothetical protein
VPPLPSPSHRGMPRVSGTDKGERSPVAVPRLVHGPAGGDWDGTPGVGGTPSIGGGHGRESTRLSPCVYMGNQLWKIPLYAMYAMYGIPYLPYILCLFLRMHVMTEKKIWGTWGTCRTCGLGSDWPSRGGPFDFLQGRW